MNHNVKRQQHEQARKRLKQERQQHAREVAKQPRSGTPRWLLIGGIAMIVVFVIIVAFGL